MTDYDLLRLLYRYLDKEALFREHPELTKQDLDGLFRRLAAATKAPRTELLAYFDGATQGNPGSSAAGVIILDKEGNTIEELGLPLGKCTNNEAEYKALLIAVERLLELKASHITLVTDSELLYNQFQGTYRIKQPHLAQLHLRAREFLRQFASWKIELIPRGENKRADSLASTALAQLK